MKAYSSSTFIVTNSNTNCARLSFVLTNHEPNIKLFHPWPCELDEIFHEGIIQRSDHGPLNGAPKDAYEVQQGKGYVILCFELQLCTSIPTSPAYDPQWFNDNKPKVRPPSKRIIILSLRRQVECIRGVNVFSVLHHLQLEELFVASLMNAGINE